MVEDHEEISLVISRIASSHPCLCNHNVNRMMMRSTKQLDHLAISQQRETGRESRCRICSRTHSSACAKEIDSDFSCLKHMYVLFELMAVTMFICNNLCKLFFTQSKLCIDIFYTCIWRYLWRSIYCCV